MTLTLQQTGWIIALLVILATIYLYKLSKGSRYKEFDIVDLITTHGGKIDQHKMHLEGSFFISSYGFLYLLWSDHLTEWYFGAYMAAWAGMAGYALKQRIGEIDAPKS